MKNLSFHSVAIIAILLLTAYTSEAQVASAKENPKSSDAPVMKMYVIQRDIPGAGKLTDAELKAISQTSCSVLKEMGPKIEWLHSYVTGNQIYCIYKAENENAIREHARKGGFPANAVFEVSSVISPATAGVQ
jgi:hypothetical protein